MSCHMISDSFTLFIPIDTLSMSSIMFRYIINHTILKVLYIIVSQTGSNNRTLKKSMRTIKFQWFNELLIYSCHAPQSSILTDLRQIYRKCFGQETRTGAHISFEMIQRDFPWLTVYRSLIGSPVSNDGGIVVEISTLFNWELVIILLIGKILNCIGMLYWSLNTGTQALFT